MKRILSALITTVAVVCAVVAAPARAEASIVIDFDQLVLEGGSVTSSGGGNATGSDIIFDSIYLRVNGTAVAGVQCGGASTNGDATDADACTLDFDTATGTFTVTANGGLYDIGADLLPYTGDVGSQIVADGTVILSGTIEDFIFLAGAAFLGFGQDTKDADLLAFFGLDPSLAFNFSNSELMIGLSGDNVEEADLINSVPEPGTLALLGIGLVAAGRSIRRRRRV